MAKKSTEKAPKDGVYLADGTYIKAEAGLNQPDLWIWFDDAAKDGDLLKYARLFSNAAKTARFTCVYAGGRQSFTWEGYTRLEAILINKAGCLNIRMRKEEG